MWELLDYSSTSGGFVIQERGRTITKQTPIVADAQNAFVLPSDSYMNEFITDPPESTKEGISEPTHMYGPFYSTGDNFEAFKEQGLVIKTETGGVLITGCGHPGVVEMVTVAKNKLGIEIHTVIGGLHLMRTPGEKIDQISDALKKMGVKQICPTHCTGDKSIALLKEAFGEGYISGGTGKEIIIQDF